MKIKYLLVAALCALSLSGCSLISNSSTTKIHTIEAKENAAFEAFGAERMDVLGMVAYKDESRCSAVDLLKQAVKAYPEADDVINVQMEETETKKGSKKTYSCKYTGLAVSYTPMSIVESKAWVDSKKEEKAKSTVVVVPPPAPTPCTPCACVTCGCTPCNPVCNK